MDKLSVKASFVYKSEAARIGYASLDAAPIGVLIVQ